LILCQVGGTAQDGLDKSDHVTGDDRSVLTQQDGYFLRRSAVLSRVLRVCLIDGLKIEMLSIRTCIMSTKTAVFGACVGKT
jgi:hypothetical protein